MARPGTLLTLLTALATSASCLGDDAWWLGDEEPDYTGKADADVPLTIYITHEQPTIRKILSKEAIGDLSRGRTGYLNLDGRSLNEDVVLIFDGEVHRFDGKVDRILTVIQPTYISNAAGAANPDGFLKVDFKALDTTRHHGSDALARHAGVYRGDIIATDKLGVGDPLPEDLTDLLIRPDNAFQRPPNYLRDVDIFITPNVALTRLSPAASSCFGDDIVDVTLSDTDLAIEVEVEGFPDNVPVTVELIRRDPQTAGGGFWEHLIDPVTGLWEDELEETVETRTAANGEVVKFANQTTLEAGFFENKFNSYYEVRAYAGNDRTIFAKPYIHEMTVVDSGEEIIVDQFELCPFEDDACRALRDKYAPENVVARRNVIEWKAAGQGLYETITRPIGSCSGGDAISGEFSDTCKVYRESTDSELEANVSAELQFELTANGKAQGEASWSGGVNGLASAEIEAAFKAEFNIEASLDASFSASRTWASHSSLDVLYDPSNTQLQWWRVVTPRLRYLEIAEFNVCGARLRSTDLFLSDLRDSRLVLACEEVPSFDTVCHAVEPTADTVAACNELLIDPESAEGKQCLAAD